MTGRFDTGPLVHKVLLGSDYFRGRGERENGFHASLPIDIFNPVYGVISRQEIEALPLNFFRDFESDQYGLYFQDQITLWDTLHLLGGGRYDWSTVGSGGSSTSLAEAEARLTEETGEDFSPRVGLVYQPWSWLSLYGNYVESFGLNNGFPAPGQAPFDPQTATQYEVGVKTDFFDGALTSTLAFYHLTKDNILTADLSTLDPFDQRPVGEQRSQGIELDVSGQVTENVSLIGSYAFTDTEVLDDRRQFDDGTGNIITTQGNAGHRFHNVPRHAGSLFAKYAFQEAQLRGLSLGAGVFAASQREGDLENSFQLPGYVRLDAFAAYEWKIGPSRVTAQLNINNLLDKEYFEGSGTQIGIPRLAVFPGAPRTFLGSVRVEW